MRSGCLLVNAKRYDEANRRFDEAEQLGLDAALIRYNRGVVLLEQGDPAAATPLFESAARGLRRSRPGARFVALAELGRIEEARIQLRLAEDCRQTTLVLGAAARAATTDMIERCRNQLSALKPGDLRALDEL